MIQAMDIGCLSGKTLLFGGVYSNLEALLAIQAIAEKNNIAPSNIICTGDIVGYCADPEACLQHIKAWGIHCIAGNVELNLKDASDSCGCNFDEGGRCDNFSKMWYPFAQSKVTPDALRFIETIPEFIHFEYASKKCFVLHGSIDNTSEFIFKSSESDIKSRIFEQTEADLIIAGHAGLPFSQVMEDKIWLNPGVIGMPANDGTTRVWYAILEDTPSFSFEILPLDYDYLKASAKIESNPLPATYADTLRTGIWDNVEILPLMEQKQQGKALPVFSE